MPVKTVWMSALVLALALPGAAEPTKGHVPSNLGTLVSLNRGEQTFVEYRFSDNDFKPYVQAFRSPSGINVLRDRPYDHLHHRGLMFAVNMNGIEFWGQGWYMGSLGQQVYRADSVSLDRKSNCLTGDLAWNSLATKTHIMAEHRKIRLLDSNTIKATILAWESAFSVPASQPKAIWKGDHYHGLGMRFAKEMDESDQFFFATDAQKPEHVRGTEFLTRASWAAYHATSEGREVTVAMFDAPDNPRYPAHWFTMYTPFSFLSATTNTYREPLEINPGQTIRFRYGIAVLDGHTDAAEIERLYRYWLRASTKH
ncbi:MAG: hypothetical protein GY809_17605 [Planctomycetes bacterium]|nr:hypothetical protein [Planctomycetota bacterium]